jgi:hypothetical protein
LYWQGTFGEVPLDVIFVIGAAGTLLLYCDVEPIEVPFDGEFEGTQLVAAECLGGKGSLRRSQPSFSSSTTLVHADAIILPRSIVLFPQGWPV